MSAVVGIDLGTTNTVVAVVEGGKAQALADDSGERLIPSVVSFHPSGQVIVGRAAKERRLIDAPNTIYSIKRLIGRAWDSDDVKRARKRFPFELREGPGHAVLCVARGETYTLSEISAYVLRKAKAVAEAALGQPVERAVITVPANFNDLQRAATKVAGRVAGLEVLRILNEPTAAALAYGYGKSNAERIAIYDFGGGTFDVTLLDLSGNVFEVLATAGDTFLGGDDVDILIADKMADAFLAQHRYDPRSDSQVFERLRYAAETIKHALSTETEASVELKEITFGAGGKALSSTFSMKRSELDKLIMPLVDRTFAVCKDALGTARAAVKEFDQVILVGGSTRIPLVRERVADFFGRDPLGHVSPDEVVAIGAGIQAMALTSHERRREGPASNPPDVSGRPRTLGGLGEQAAAARARTDQGVAPGPRGRTDPALLGRPRTEPAVGKTDPGLGGAARIATGQVGGIVAPGNEIPKVAGAATERAPSTADFGGIPQRGSAPELGRPPPLPRKPPPKPHEGATKLSHGADAKKALDQVRTEDSVLTALPLIGGAPGASALMDAMSENEPTVTRQAAAFALDDEQTNRLSQSQIDEPTVVRGKLPNFETPAAPPPRPPQRSAPAFDGPPPMRAPMRSAPPEPPPMRPPQRSAPAFDAPARAPERSEPMMREPSMPDFDALPLVQPDAGPPLVFDPPPPLAPPPPKRGPGATQVLAAVAPPEPFVAPPLVQHPPLAQSPPAAPVRSPAAATMPLQPMGQMPSVPPMPAIKEMRAPAAPLLVDVTPLSLCVETLGGYTDVIISRNTPVPCDRTRVFVTAKNYQRVVKVRVAQGESQLFHENVQLGEVELTGLREGMRGDVEISVTFEIDTDGILQVRAKDVGTGHEAQASLRLVGVDQGQNTDAMRARQQKQVVV